MKSTTNRLSFIRSLFVCLNENKKKQKESQLNLISNSILPFILSYPFLSIQFNSIPFKSKSKGKQKREKAIDNSNKQTLISVFGAFEEIWLIDWLVIKWWWELIDWLGERREDKQEKDQTIQSSIQSKQTNKQKRGKKTIQSNAPKRQKSIENNRTEQKRNETKEKLLKSQQINQTKPFIWIELNWEVK